MSQTVQLTLRRTGYSVVSMLYQSTTNGIDAHYGKAVLGLTQAYCFNWMYFEIDGSNLHVHAIRRHKWTAMTWNMCKSDQRQNDLLKPNYFKAERGLYDCGITGSAVEKMRSINNTIKRYLFKIVSIL